MNKIRLLFFIPLLLQMLPTFSDDIKSLTNFNLIGQVRTMRETVQRYEIENGRSVSKGMRSKKYMEFDEEGRLILDINYNWNGQLANQTTFIFSDSGQIKKMAYDTYNYEGRWYSTTSTSMEWDSTDILRQKIEETEVLGTKGKFITTFKFDEMGTLIARIAKDATGAITEDWSRTPTDDGEQIASNNYYNSRISQTQITLIDNQRRVTAQSLQLANGNTTNWVYTYDENGPLIEVLYTSLENEKTRWEFEYNRMGSRRKSTQSDSTGKIILERSYHFDSEGNIQTQTANWFEENEVSYSIISIYDEKGNIISRQVRNPLLNYFMTWVHEYDDENRIIYEEVVDTGNNKFSSQETGYDERGNQNFNLKTTLDIESGFQSEQLFDSEENLILNRRVALDGTNSTIQRYAYNVNGEKIEDSNLNTDGSILTQSIYQYEWDDIGNWLTKKTYYTDNLNESYNKLTENYRRRISYY